MPQGCCALHHSGSKISLPAGIGQPSHGKVIVNAISQDLESIVVYVFIKCRQRLKFNDIWDNLGR